MYNLVYDEKALQNLKKLERKIRKRIFEKIYSTKENPLHYFERLTGRSEFKLRIGDYQVIAVSMKRQKGYLFLSLIIERIFTKNYNFLDARYKS